MRRTPNLRTTHLRSGSLADLPFGRLFFGLATERRTLCLEIRRRHVRKTIVFEDGSPVDCRTNLVHETLGRFLVSQGQISEFQYHESLARAAESGVRMGEVLIELGLIGESQLQVALEASLGRKLLECFTWQDGEFRVLSELPVDKSGVIAEINVAQLLFTGITRFSADMHVQQEIGALIGKDLILVADGPIELDSIQCSRPQRRLISRLRRPAAVEDLLRNAGMSKAELLRTLYALSVMGLVRTAARDGASPIKPPNDASEQPVEEIVDLSELEELQDPDKADSEPPALDSIESLRRQIVHDHGRYRDLDPRAILGFAPDRRRYVELCDRYAPSRFETSELADVVEMAAELLCLTVRGYEAMREPVEAEPTTVSITKLSAEHQVELATEYDQQGLEQLSIGNFGAATDLLSLAADCDPNNSAHAVDLAYARFREDPENAQQSLDELLKLSREGYISPLVYLYCAEICSSLDDWAAAATYFHTGCELWNGLHA